VTGLVHLTLIHDDEYAEIRAGDEFVTIMCAVDPFDRR
jgi:hypothetical protein